MQPQNIDETYKHIGESIFIFNEVETYINSIICHFIQPEDPVFFVNYFLNSSVTNFGTKIKMLTQTKYFDEKGKQINKLRDFGNNRNVFAHSNRTLRFEATELDATTIQMRAEDVIYKTTSNGKIAKIEYSAFLAEHLKLQTEVVNILTEIVAKYDIQLPSGHITNLQRFLKE